jgi:hypothetical protein
LERVGERGDMVVSEVVGEVVEGGRLGMTLTYGPHLSVRKGKRKVKGERERGTTGGLVLLGRFGRPGLAQLGCLTVFFFKQFSFYFLFSAQLFKI